MLHKERMVYKMRKMIAAALAGMMVLSLGFCANAEEKLDGGGATLTLALRSGT